MDALLSIFNLMSAVGMLSVIISQLIVLVINKSVSKNYNDIYYKSQDSVEAVARNIEFQMPKTGYGLIDDNANISGERDIIPKTEYAVASRVYGPNSVMKFNAYYNLGFAILFLAMGIIYIMTEFHEKEMFNKVKDCFSQKQLNIPK